VDGLLIIVVTHQLQVELGTESSPAKDQHPKTVQCNHQVPGIFAVSRCCTVSSSQFS